MLLKLSLVAAFTFGNWGAAMAKSDAKPVDAPINGPLVRMAELEIDPAQLDAYRLLLSEEIKASLKSEPGVLTLFAVAVKDSPTRIRILEVYADQAAYEAHLRSPHFRTYKTRSTDMVRSLNLVEVDPILLCSKADAASGC
jgi:quinol monooxygenase YgiN